MKSLPRSVMGETRQYSRQIFHMSISAIINFETPIFIFDIHAFEAVRDVYVFPIFSSSQQFPRILYVFFYISSCHHRFPISSFYVKSFVSIILFLFHSSLYHRNRRKCCSDMEGSHRGLIGYHDEATFFSSI